MQTNVLPDMDMSDSPTGCCPRFDPAGWDGRNLHLENKLFVRATTRSLLHAPLNMGKVFTRVQGHIEDAGAQDPDGYLVFSRDLSATESEHFFAVTGPVPEEEMATLSGDFITRVFEGSYRKAGDWMHEMEVAAKASGHRADVSSCSTQHARNARAAETTSLASRNSIEALNWRYDDEGS